MAHSWVQMFPDEYTAFETYCKLYPNNATLLVDTYKLRLVSPTPSRPSKTSSGLRASGSAVSALTPAT